MHGLDLPRGEHRELVVDRDRMYELNGEDSRTLAVVGTFRIVPKQDLDTEQNTFRHLRDEDLVETVDLGGDERGLTLTKEGRDLLDSHTLERDGGTEQAFHAGVSRPREIDHDANLYATFCQEEARHRDEHADLEIRRVIVEQDLKRDYQDFLQDHNRNHSDSDGRPDRTDDEIRDWARDHDLPYFDGQVHFPDYRIEYEVDGREHHEDVELFTPHYRGAHAASRGKTGSGIDNLFHHLAMDGLRGRARTAPSPYSPRTSNMKLLAWNILHGGGKRPIVSAITGHNPDVMVLSEYRAHASGRPCEELRRCGWPHFAASGVIGREDGVAILSRESLEPASAPLVGIRAMGGGDEDSSLGPNGYRHLRSAAALWHTISATILGSPSQTG